MNIIPTSILIFAASVFAQSDVVVTQDLSDNKSVDDKSVILIQSAHFDHDNQMPIELSPQCQAAVSLDNHIPNQYCHANCVGWEKELLDDSEFFSSCKIDKRLQSFATSDTVATSTCFSEWVPTAINIADHFPIEYPGACQAACQDNDECVWFSILKRKDDTGSYRCALYDHQSVVHPLAVVASGQEGQCGEHGIFQGSAVDCGIGSNMCITEVVKSISELEYAMMGFGSEETVGLSGPKYCRASSNNVGDSICSTIEDIFDVYYRSGDEEDETMKEMMQIAHHRFHGTDHLFGAGSLFPMSLWNEIHDVENQRFYTDHKLPFIDRLLNGSKIIVSR